MAGVQAMHGQIDQGGKQHPEWVSRRARLWSVTAVTVHSQPVTGCGAQTVKAECFLPMVFGGGCAGVLLVFFFSFSWDG